MIGVTILVLILFQCTNIIFSKSNFASGIVMDDIDRISLWSTGAYKWLQNFNCNKVPGRFGFTDVATCLEVKSIAKKDMRIYAAVGNASTKLLSELPDSGIKLESPHDGILVLDPFPSAKFGHLVLLFTIDVMSSTKCLILGGHSLSDNGDCIQIYLKEACRQEITKKKWHRYKSCEVMFLPYVSQFTASSNDVLNNENWLGCVPVPEFHPQCPPSGLPTNLAEYACEALKTNTWRCNPRNLRSECNAKLTCDNAVIISSDMNRQILNSDSYNMTSRMQDMLVEHGFRKNNINVFYNNGLQSNETDDDYQNIFLPTQKRLIRNHLQYLCEKSHCSDTLYIYLRTLTLPDGSMVLWDTNSNGKFDEGEIYRPMEFLDDISSCNAKRVIVVADQSFSAGLVTTAKDYSSFYNTSLGNVMIFPSTLDWSRRDNQWLSELFLHSDHIRTCLEKLGETHQGHYQNASIPLYIGQKTGLTRSTLLGKPCGLWKMATKEVLRKYGGCSLITQSDHATNTDETDDYEDYET
ncbi:hypothetical protein M8J76_009955 [Diaphorina citri]|nr:hypothetical protein M8J76_009955 [Diaphorina citri]